jgi:RNA polymerase sigma factor (TIGR02999 family)
LRNGHHIMNAESISIATASKVPSATEILPLVYSELRRIAAGKLQNEPANRTLQPTALVHEAWLRLRKIQPGIWDSREHFVAAAAQAMRRILLDRARSKHRLKRNAGVRVEWDPAELVAEAREDPLLRLDEALQGLEAADPDLAQVVVLKFYGGLTNQEVGQTLGVTERTVERKWSYAKAWLFSCMRESARA